MFLVEFTSAACDSQGFHVGHIASMDNPSLRIAAQSSKNIRLVKAATVRTESDSNHPLHASDTLTIDNRKAERPRKVTRYPAPALDDGRNGWV
jgi:hypothetical protein